jgi:hypothetical protein
MTFNKDHADIAETMRTGLDHNLREPDDKQAHTRITELRSVGKEKP